MSDLLHKGDAVLVQLNANLTRIGWIKCWVKHDKRTYVGVEFVESIPNGHDGKVNGNRHFKAQPGHGAIVPITNIQKKLSASQLTKKMQQIISLCLDKFHLYIEAVAERDAAIAERDQMIKMYQEEIHRLNQLNSNNNNKNDKMSEGMNLFSNVILDNLCTHRHWLGDTRTDLKATFKCFTRW